MQADLILKNANLPDGRTGVDIACKNGKIIEIGPQLPILAAEEIDCDGMLVSPPFVDSHFHMDATLSLGLPRMNESGTLLEGIALWGELKPILTIEAVIERALRYCDLAVSKGLLAIRTHVDVCDDRLLAVDALLEVKNRSHPISTCNWWRFPRMAICAARRQSRMSFAHLIKASMLSAASAFRTHHGRRRAKHYRTLRNGGQTRPSG